MDDMDISELVKNWNIEFQHLAVIERIIMVH